jgi:hypothetical protein
VSFLRAIVEFLEVDIIQVTASIHLNTLQESLKFLKGWLLSDTEHIPHRQRSALQFA